jgi:hypothetical protein
MSKATISMNGAPLGELACEYARVMEFNAPAKVTTSVSMLGQNITNVIKLSDWKVEASPGAEKKSDAPPPKGKAAEKAKASK